MTREKHAKVARSVLAKAYLSQDRAVTGVVRFFVPMNPVPKGRPRMTRRGIAYTPKRTSDAEKVIAMAARKAWRGEPDAVSRFTLKVVVHFRLKGRGDWDNYGKIVSDSLNGIVWKDDAQVDYGSVEMWRNSPRIEGLDIEVRRC